MTIYSVVCVCSDYSSIVMNVLNVYVYSRQPRVMCYVIDANKLSQYEHECKDTFLSWQIYEMIYRKGNYYNRLFESSAYITFFADFLKSHYAFDDSACIESIRVTSDCLHLNDSRDIICIGSDDDEWE